MTQYPDAFDRANGALGADWETVYIDGDDTILISSNEAVFTTVGGATNAYATVRYTTAMGATDYETTIEARGSSASVGVGVMICLPTTGTGSANVDGYWFGYYPSDAYYIIEIVNGQDGTVLASGGTPGSGTARVLRAVKSGSDLELYVDGAGTPLLTASDSTYNTAGVGFAAGLFGTASSTNNGFDDFLADDFLSSDPQVSVSDAVTVGEAVAAQVSDPQVSVTDAVTVGESVAVSVEAGAPADLSINVSDGLTIGEALAVQTSDPQVSVVDAVLVRDTFGSLQFFGNDNGTGTTNIDRVRIPRENPLGTDTPADVGAGDYTLEVRLRPHPTNNASSSIADARESNIFWDGDIWSDSRGQVWGLTNTVNGLVQCFGVAGAGSWTTIYGTTDLSDDAWHHLALTRDQSTGEIILWIDGVQDANGTYTTGSLEHPDGVDSGSPNDSDHFWVLGAEKHDANAALYLSYYGYMTEARISNSERYTGTFTPPGAQFSDDANTMVLFHFDEGSGTTLDNAASVTDAALADGIILQGGTAGGPVWASASPFAVLALEVINNLSVADAVTTGEAVVLAVSAPQAATVDAVTVGEVVSLAVVTEVIISDGVIVAEAVTLAVSTALVVTDAATVGEALALTVSDPALAVVDAVTIGEALALAVSDPALTVVDGVTLVEVISLTIDDLLLSVTDSVTVAEALNLVVSEAGVITVSVVDGVSVGEALTLVVSDPQVEVVDSVTIGEAVSLSVTSQGDLSLAVSEAVTVGEVVSLTVSDPQVTIVEAVTVGEALTLQTEALSLAVVDAVTVGEAVGLDVALSLMVIDAVTTGEALALDTALNITVVDSVTVGEVVTLDPLLLILAVLDSVTVGEAVTIGSNAINVDVTTLTITTTIKTLKFNTNPKTVTIS